METMLVEILILSNQSLRNPAATIALLNTRSLGTRYNLFSATNTTFLTSIIIQKDVKFVQSFLPSQVAEYKQVH